MQYDRGIHIFKDREVLAHSTLIRIIPDDSGTERMKRADLHLGGLVEQLLDLRPHISCGCSGECQSKYLLRIDPEFLHHIRNLHSDGGGLAGACTSQDQERTAGVGHGILLAVHES